MVLITHDEDMQDHPGPQELDVHARKFDAAFQLTVRLMDTPKYSESPAADAAKYAASIINRLWQDTAPCED